MDAIHRWHEQQRQRATTRPTFTPEIPQDHRCPGGACSSSPPPLPSGTGTESFTAQASLPFAWYITVAAAFGLFVILTRRSELK
jgi:hypothetical protein